MVRRHALVTAAASAMLLITASCDNPPGAEGTVAPGADYQPRVMAVCQETLGRIDCGCFWDKAQPAFTKANVDGILAALIEREALGHAITRVRLEKVAGPENSRVLGRALFDCVK